MKTALEPSRTTWKFPAVSAAGWRALLVCLVLGVATWMAYWPVLRNDFIRFDDPDYVTANPHVRTGLSWANFAWALTSGYACNWHPLTWVSHMLDVQFFGLDPAGHHFTSLLLHSVNAILLFVVLRSLTGGFWRCGFVAALFALHPLHVESVAWVAERKDVLSTCFFLLTLLAYGKYVQGAEGRGQRTEDRGQRSEVGGQRAVNSATGFYGLALVLFALGLMSKPMLVTLPCVLLLLDYWPLARYRDCTWETMSKTARVLVREKLPFFYLAAAASLLTLFVQDKSHAITIGLPFPLRVMNAVASFIKYLGKTFWPENLAVFYPHPDTRYFAPATDAAHPRSLQWPLGVLVLGALALLAVSVLAVLRRRRAPWFTTGWFWYLGMLVPVIGLIQMGSQAMADRYTYIPVIGIFICLVWSAQALCGASKPALSVVTAIGLVLVSACAVVTHHQVKYWRNNLTLFEHALAVTPDNSFAQYHIAVALGEQGKYDEAMKHFDAALVADPANGDAQCARAFTLELMGKPNAAVEEYRAGLKLRPFNTQARHRLAALLQAQGKAAEALEQYSEAIRFDPENGQTRFLAGTALLGAGQLAQAEEQFSEALRLLPDNAELLDRLAQTYFREGKLLQAAARFNELVKLEPARVEARINLGGTLWRLGRREEAVVQFNEALRLKPEYPVAHYNLGAVLLAQGKLTNAIAELEQAMRLKPDYAEALNDLARALAFEGKQDESRARFLELLRLSPTNSEYLMNFAGTLLLAGHTNEAASRFAEAARVEPDLPEKLVRAGMALAAQGKPDEAITQFRTALWLKPEWPVALNDLAWLLATHPRAEARQGEEAVRLAERAAALDGGKEPRYWSTLATAYAAAGRFPESITTAEKAKELALAAGDKQAADAAEQRLLLFRQGKPYHQ